jgi:hypothetical protein
MTYEGAVKMKDKINEVLTDIEATGIQCNKGRSVIHCIHVPSGLPFVVGRGRETVKTKITRIRRRHNVATN